MKRLRPFALLLVLVACGSGADRAEDDASSTNPPDVDAADFDGGPSDGSRVPRDSDANSNADAAVPDASNPDASNADASNADAADADSGADQDAGADQDSGQDAGFATGTLDPGFGTGGVVSVASAGNEHVLDLAVQPDGKIVVVGDTPSGMLVLRFLPDGNFDPAFGSAGRVVVAVGDFGGAAYGVALQSDGAIVAVGRGYRGGYPQLAAVRLLANGALDPTFGTAGIALPMVSGGGSSLASSASASDVAIRGDGTLVVCGSALRASQNVGLVARLTSAGALDASFGSGGYVTMASGAGGGFSRLALQTDTKIVLAGTSSYSYSTGSGTEWWLARFSAAGAPDTTFGGGGQIHPPIGGTDSNATSIVVLPSGKILSSGSEYGGPPGGSNMALYRQETTGAGDNGYGSLGRITWMPSSFLSASAFDLALQGDGSVVVVGEGYTSSLARPVILARRTASGAFDATFGSGGSLLVPIGTRSAHARAVGLQNGAVYVTGWASSDTDDDVFLARIH